MKHTQEDFDNMTPDTLEQEHFRLVQNLEKDPLEIIQTLNAHKVSLWHMLTGLQGEVGELTDAVKKFIIYGKALDRANVIEELGDIEFYLQGIRANLDIARETTLEANILKLQVRYKDGYSDAAAIERTDKQLSPEEETERIQAIMHEQATSNRK